MFILLVSSIDFYHLFVHHSPFKFNFEAKIYKEIRNSWKCIIFRAFKFLCDLDKQRSIKLNANLNIAGVEV